jgi:hypothetical protein
MIKRLTDDPKKLAEVRPDLQFPSGLQPVLDAALTRTPGERYPTVAKFAEDVLAVVQLVRATRGGVAPATREVVEGRTQMLESRETKAQAGRRAPPPKAKRSLVPVLVGVIAVLGAGGGGWVLLGRNTSAAPTDSALTVTPDTTKLVTAADTSKQAPSVQLQTTPLSQPGGRDTAKTTRPPVVPGTPQIDPARAGDILDALIDQPNAQVIADSAQLVYNTRGVSTANKAFAACLVAQAHRTLGDREAALRWARLGLNLNSGLSSCQEVIQNPSPRP